MVHFERISLTLLRTFFVLSSIVSSRVECCMPPKRLFSLPFILPLLLPVKKEELRTLERKLVVLLEEQQRELESIRRRQEKKGELLVSAYSSRNDGSTGDIVGAGANGPSAKDKRQAAQLMQSTETLMKFGFMSMSMTYFSSLNMIRAMRSVGATDTVMAALAHSVDAPRAHDGGGGLAEDSRALALEQNEKIGAEPFRPALKPGQLPGQEPLAVSAWSVDDVARWLQVHPPRRLTQETRLLIITGTKEGMKEGSKAP